MEFYYALFLFFLKICIIFTMIHTFCILQKMTFSAFHYLTLSVRCEELDAHINYIYFWKAHTVNTFWRNFINIWGGADFGPYSSQSFDRLIGTYTSPYWKSGISTTSVRNPRSSIRTSASACFFRFDNLKTKHVDFIHSFACQCHVYYTKYYNATCNAVNTLI